MKIEGKIIGKTVTEKAITLKIEILETMDSAFEIDKWISNANPIEIELREWEDKKQKKIIKEE